MHASITTPSPAYLLQCFALEARGEFLRLLRAPSFALPTLLFPPMFYLLFAIVLGRHGDADPMRAQLLAGYGVFGVMSPGLFGFGVTIAMDRERGWLDLKRALPLPPGILVLAKLAMAMLFATVIFLVLAVLAVVFGGVRLPAQSWLALLATDVLGVLPFCAIGLTIGLRVSGQAAVAVANLVYLPMSFLSGLFVPMAAMPALLQEVAPLWPAWHLGRIALAVVGQAPAGSIALHVGALALTTVVFTALAARRLRASHA